MVDFSRNGPALWDAILEQVGQHWQPIVAGGAIRDFILNVPPKDIDVFVPAQFVEDVTSIVASLNPLTSHGRIIWINQEAYENTPDLQFLEANQSAEEYSGDGFAPDLIAVWDGEILTVPVNIIGRRMLEDGPAALVNTFDFDVLKAYHEKGTTVFTDAASRDLAKRTATLSHSQSYEQSLRRFARFNKREPGLLALRDPFSQEF